MRRTPLAVLALLVTAAACQDSVTAPDIATSAANLTLRLRTGEPPPPPIDSGAVGSTTTTSDFLVNTRYFYNKTGNNGWLTFSTNQALGVLADANARIKLANDGTFDGKGIVQVTQGGGVLTIDLSKVSQSSTFMSCSEGCFNLIIDDATFTRAIGDPGIKTQVNFKPFTKGDDTCVDACVAEGGGA